jgi:hypothetical protein
MRTITVLHHDYCIKSNDPRRISFALLLLYADHIYTVRATLVQGQISQAYKLSLATSFFAVTFSP